MKRNIRYDKNYRPAIICLIIAIASISWIVATAAALFALPDASQVLGLGRWAATTTLFFVPTVTGAALMLATNYWFIAEGRRIGLYAVPENELVSENKQL